MDRQDRPIIIYLAATEDGVFMKIGGTSDLYARVSQLNALSYAVFGSKVRILRTCSGTRADELRIKRELGIPREWFQYTEQVYPIFDAMPPVAMDPRFCSHGRTPEGCEDCPQKSHGLEVFDRQKTHRRMAASERNLSMVAMRIGPPIQTLEHVAKRFGVTRERVRQILESVSVDERTAKAIGNAKHNRVPKKVRPLSPATFAKFVKRWLKDAGYLFSKAGKHVKERCEFPPKEYPMCRECNTLRARSRRISNPDKVREQTKRYRHLHPETSRRATQKYQENHREEINERAKVRRADKLHNPEYRERERESWRKAAARLAEKMLDPEFRDKEMERRKDRYRKLMADPERAARVKQKSKERYLRKKETR